MHQLISKLVLPPWHQTQMLEMTLHLVVEGLLGWMVDLLVQSSGTDPPDNPAMGLFGEGARSFWRRSMMNIISYPRRTFPQDLSGNSILLHESWTFDRDVTAHTVTSNQDGSDTKLSMPGVFISPE